MDCAWPTWDVFSDLGMVVHDRRRPPAPRSNRARLRSIPGRDRASASSRGQHEGSHRRSASAAGRHYARKAVSFRRTGAIKMKRVNLHLIAAAFVTIAAFPLPVRAETLFTPWLGGNNGT